MPTAGGTTTAQRRGAPAQPRATYRDVLDAPSHRVAEIVGGVPPAAARDAGPVRIRPFEAVPFDLGDLWA